MCVCCPLRILNDFDIFWQQLLGTTTPQVPQKPRQTQSAEPLHLDQGPHRRTMSKAEDFITPLWSPRRKIWYDIVYIICMGLCVCVCLWLFACWGGCLFVCLFVGLFVCLLLFYACLVCLCVALSVTVCFWVSVNPFVWFAFDLCVCACVSLRMSLWPSVSLFVWVPCASLCVYGGLWVSVLCVSVLLGVCLCMCVCVFACLCVSV